MTEPYELPRHTERNRNWIDRVRAADAEAERAYRYALDLGDQDNPSAASLIAIAAELRAARIARRPGAGQ